jgi:hypothetical protein
MSDTPWARIRHADGTATECEMRRQERPGQEPFDHGWLVVPPPGLVPDESAGDKLEYDLAADAPVASWWA